MKKATHILAIRFSAMGDVAMTVPVLRVFSQMYPEVQVTMVSRPFFKPLFEGITNLNFLGADVKGNHKGLGIFKLAGEAKNLGIDAVADLHNVIRSKLMTTYFRSKGIKTVTINKGRAEKRVLTQNSIGEIFQLKTTHQRYADVFEKMGFPLNLETHILPERKKLTPQLTALLGVEQKKIIGIAPFAAFESKTYPLDLMKKVIEKLDVQNKFRIFLFGGGEKEIKVLSAWEKQFQNVTSIAGKFQFKDELALISNLDIMLSMDSGNGHLAAIFGVPVVTLWGVTHPFAGFTPFNQPLDNQLTVDREKYPLIPTSVYGNKFPKGYENAMRTISPEKVVEKIVEVVSRKTEVGSLEV